MALQVDRIRESLNLVAQKEAFITPHFYARFFSRYPQVKPLFRAEAASEQQKMLQEAIVAVVDHIEDSAWLTNTLRGMGAQHVDYGVADHMYPWVQECLLDTLAEIAADEWTPEYHAAWQEALEAICALMLEGAGHRRAAEAAPAP